MGSGNWSAAIPCPRPAVHGRSQTSPRRAQCRGRPASNRRDNCSGCDDGRPLTSVQTPLATLHKFQGWADKFLTTPPNGLRDLYANGGYGWKSVAGFDAINAAVIYHRFDSDRLNIAYGSEWDAIVSAKRGRWTATAKFADYRAKAFASDTRKIWLMLEWAY